MISTSHLELIKCPGCGNNQVAEILHTWPFWSYVHECACGQLIGESDWEPVDSEADPHNDQAHPTAAKATVDGTENL